MLNKSNIEHAIIAMMVQFLFFFATGNILLSSLAPLAFFLGREHAQREYKIGDPSKLKGYEAFDIWKWKKDAIMDLMAPVFAVSVVSIILWKLN